MAKILLDPGHGRDRRGFVNVPGWKWSAEGENNFIYARDYLKPALERVGFIVGMTKTSMDQNPSLKARGNMGRGYDLLLSIHTNASEEGDATGTEIWDSTNPKESDPKMFGELSSVIAKTIGTKDRGVKYKKNSKGSNSYGILRHGYAKKNAIIEHVFHDNYADIKKFIDNMSETAEATANVLAKYYNLKGKPTRQDPIKQPEKKETKVERDENLLPKWAEEEWQKAKELKITDGTRPNAFATRAEVASMIVRALEVENGKCDSADNGSTGYRTGL